MQQSSSRASPSVYGERERCNWGEGGAKAAGCGCPPSPLYIGPLGGAPALEIHLQGGGGQGGWLAPQAMWGAPCPRVSNPRRRGEDHGGRTSPLWAGSLPTSAHGALRDRWPHPVDPPGTLRWSRYNTDNPETCSDVRMTTFHI